MILKPLPFIAFLVVLLAFSSCKKSGGGVTPISEKPFQFTANGSSVSYANCFYTEPFANANFEVLIMATNTLDTKTSSSFILNFQIILLTDAGGPQVGKTYPVAAIPDQAGTAKLYYTPDGVKNFQTQYANAQGAVTITSISSKAIGGTFSGKLFADGDTNGQTVLYTITDGSFNAAAD